MTVINWFDKIKFSFSTLPPTQHHSSFNLFTACQSGGERNWTLNYANRNGFSHILCKMKCCKIDKRLPFFLEGSILRHDQASNKTFCLMYRTAPQVVDNFQERPSFGIARRLLFLQLNMASLVEQKTTPVREENATSKNNTNQNTTRTTHNDSVRQQVFLIYAMDDDSHR